jgi:5-methyltetrahydropteroyltriglutamate--homocysteine methyltransferase
LEEALNDATALAISSQEQAGLDIITDGEIRRESYTNRFATALGGIDNDNPGTALDRSGHPNPVPRIIGPIRREGPIEVADLQFLISRLTKPGALTKITVPGPFTLSQQAQNDYYPNSAELAMAYADVVREEVADLFAAGADIVQLDEPYMEARPEAARDYGISALNRALEGASGTTAVHVCFGYAAIIHARSKCYAFLPELAHSACNQISIETAQSNLDLSVLTDLNEKQIILGVLDLSDPEIESADTVAARIRRALVYAEPEQIIVAPDCGMKYLPRGIADGKTRAMVAGAAIVRKEIGGHSYAD